MPIEALIFDLDGTLVDTAPDLMMATNHVLQFAGRPEITAAQLRQFVGHGSMALIKLGLEASGPLPDEATLQQLQTLFLGYYGKNIVAHSKLFSGVVALLEKATAAGLKMGVCTNKVERLSHKLLDQIGISKYFKAVVGGDTLPIMKPNPEPYFEVARRLGVAPLQTMMFGDSETDIRTAQNAGVPVVAVSFGYTLQHVSTFKPDYVIDHYDEAWPIVLRHV